MLTEAEMAILLGRPLTTAETANFDLYLEIATDRLNDLLCVQLEAQAESPTASDRIYESRYGYRTLYVDPFSTLTSVTIDGETVDADNYTKKQNDKFNGSWYNIIEFDTKQTCERVTVNATWGFTALPADLQVLLARLFDQNSVDQTTDNLVKSKEIEDFKVTFKDGATFDEFVLANSATIDKYSQCNQGIIRHGSIHSVYYN